MRARRRASASASGVGRSESSRTASPPRGTETVVSSGRKPDRSARIRCDPEGSSSAPRELGASFSWRQAPYEFVSERPAIDLLTALFAGPNVVELDSQFRTALPAGVQLLSTTRRGGVLRVDVSKEMGQLSGEVLVAAVAQIVFTASEVDGVESVNILINGADQQWPSGNGELQSAPLTVYDYPGLVQSSQPAYPAIPTPVQP